MKIILVLLFLSASLAEGVEETVYKSDAYSIMSSWTINKFLESSRGNSVSTIEQGSFQAVIDSRIRSNFLPQYLQGIPSVITFKFSINGFDNERPPFQDHRVLIDPYVKQDSYRNTVKASFSTPVLKFGEPDKSELEIPDNPPPLSKDISVIEGHFLVYTYDIDRAIREQGFYTCWDGSQITDPDYKVYIAGGTPPLGWHFGEFEFYPYLELERNDYEGIHSATLEFRLLEDRLIDSDGYAVWDGRNLDFYEPQFHGPHRHMESLYQMSMQELNQNIRPDSTFMAGKEWTGVWTRDISYSILLATAITHPEISKNSLMAKVKDGKIIQDTGTGGSWPISSDRMTWALAAWEIYVVTGDMEWLRQSYDIISTSVLADMDAVYDKSSGMMLGESSFLDWREQTYPRWMDPKDIYQSINLGTNAVHYRTLEILLESAEILAITSPHLERYEKMKESIKSGLNTKLWMENEGYYGQYLYGRQYKSPSVKSETLGEALCVLFDIAEPDRQKQIIKNTPTTDFGPPCIYPQIPNIPPYHNDGIWPFVIAYHTWAAAKVGNTAAVEHCMASIYRAAGLFLTNKENMVASTGDFVGTEINSDRQLWSVAGNLAIVYRVLFGMALHPDYLEFNPFIPESYNHWMNLSGFKYRDGIFNITLSGYGNEISTFKIDNVEMDQPRIPGDMSGRHIVYIEMNGMIDPSEINLVKNHFSPETPDVEIINNQLNWKAIPEADHYLIIQNGERISETARTQFVVFPADGISEYQVLAVDDRGFESFLSEPVSAYPENSHWIVEPEDKNHFVTEFSGYSGDGYVTVEKNTIPISFVVHIPKQGDYRIDFHYANGHGPINTDNKACIRSIFLDEYKSGTVVFPQRGVNSWDDWGYSSSISQRFFETGKYRISIAYQDINENMNGETNGCNVDHMRVITMSTP